MNDLNSNEDSYRIALPSQSPSSSAKARITSSVSANLVAAFRYLFVRTHHFFWWRRPKWDDRQLTRRANWAAIFAVPIAVLGLLFAALEFRNGIRQPDPVRSSDQFQDSAKPGAERNDLKIVDPAERSKVGQRVIVRGFTSCPQQKVSLVVTSPNGDKVLQKEPVTIFCGDGSWFGHATFGNAGSKPGQEYILEAVWLC